VAWTFSSYGATNVICNSSGSSSISIQIFKSDFVTAVSTAVEDVYTLTNGTNTYQYYAAYVNPSGAAVTAGSVPAAAMFTVSYR